MKKTILALFMLAGASTANAVVLFQNPFPASAQGGWCSPCDAVNPDWRAFDRFSLASNSTLTGLEVALHDISPGGFVNDILVEIFADGPQPGGLLFSQIFNNSQYTRIEGFPGGPGNSFPFITFALPNVALGAGNYWLSYFGVNGSSAYGAVAASAVDGSVLQLEIGSGIYHARGDDLSFRITGNVPEPASVLLLAIGLLGFGAVAVRRKLR